MKIIFKLIFAFLIFIIFSAISVVLVINTNSLVSDDLSQVSESSVNEATIAGEISYYLQKSENILHQTLVQKTESANDITINQSYGERSREFKENLNEIKTLLAFLFEYTEKGKQIAGEIGDEEDFEEEEKEILELIKFKSELELYETHVNVFFDLLNSNHSLAKNLFEEEIRPAFDSKLLPLIKDIYDDAIEELHKEMDSIKSSLNTAEHVNKAVFSLIFFAAVLVALWISNTLVRPLKKLKEVATKVAEGEYGISTDIDSKDEIGDFAKTFEIMEEKIKLSEEQLEDAVQQRTSKLKKAYKDLKKLDATKNNFLASVSHELRTPLTTVKTYNELMRDKTLGKINNKQKEALEVSLASISQLNILIDDLLDLRKYESGKAFFVFKKKNVNDILKGVAKRLKPQLSNVKGKIKISDNGKNFNILVDPKRIEQVFSNIIHNSIKYKSKRSLEIQVDLFENNGFLNIVFEDNGKGISQKQLKHVFDKFYQGDQTQRKKQQGSGLGLAIVKYIVEAHDGEIIVKSILGKGTTITIFLPSKKR